MPWVILHVTDVRRYGVTLNPPLPRNHSGIPFPLASQPEAGASGQSSEGTTSPRPRPVLRRSGLACPRDSSGPQYRVRFSVDTYGGLSSQDEDRGNDSDIRLFDSLLQQEVGRSTLYDSTAAATGPSSVS